MDIARIANKYSFKSLETWAVDAIQEYVNRKPCPILTAIPPPTSYTFPFPNPNTSQPPAVQSTAQLTRLIHLAQLCGHERLLTTMIALLRQLMSSSLQYAYLAMTLADELDLRALRGAAYLEVMQKAVVVKRVTTIEPQNTGPSTASNAVSGAVGATAKEGDVDGDGRLVITPAQQLRLLSGYYRLTGTYVLGRFTSIS